MLIQKPASRLTVIAVATITILSLHAAVYLPFISDDALISLRYSHFLLKGFGLVWNIGERVEGYSNLLWVLLTAGIGHFTFDLVLASRLLGWISVSAIPCALAYAYRSSAERLGYWPLIFCCGFIALSGPIAIWTIGGLEQSLVAGLLAWVLALSLHALSVPQPTRLWLIGVLLALMVWSRPDSPLFVASVVLVWWATKGNSLTTFKQLLLIGGIPLLAFIAQLGFRLSYYHEWVPNTALVKAHPSLHRAIEGTRYLLKSLTSQQPFLILALLGLLANLRRGRQAAFAWLIIVPFVLWSLYVISIGGDIFPGHRHAVVLIVMIAFALLWVMTLIAPIINSFTKPNARFVAIVLTLALFFAYQIEHAENRKAFYERWEWEGKSLGVVLKKVYGNRPFNEQPLFAVTAAGSLPFWSELPALDMLGLNDYYLPRHPPSDFGHGELAHDLGDVEYVMSRQPDLLSFCGPRGSLTGCFYSDQSLAKKESFLQNYRPTWLQLQMHESSDTPPFTAILWARTTSTKLGWQSNAMQITLPALLLSSAEHPTTMNDQGQLHVVLKAGDAVTLKQLQVIDTNWQLANASALQLTLTAIGDAVDAKLTALQDVTLTQLTLQKLGE